MRLILALFVSCCALAATACSCPAPPAPVPDKSNGAFDRAIFYRTAEGSEIYPLAWMKALKSARTGRPFAENLERFGFLSDPGNPDDLPVGLAAAPSRGLEILGKMVGLNCAACHVAEMTYRGQTLRIDGAPNLFDARNFFSDLADSAKATLADPDELMAFLHRFLAAKESGADPSPVRQFLKHLVETQDAGQLKVLIRQKLKDFLEEEKSRPPLDQARVQLDAKTVLAKLEEKFKNDPLAANLQKLLDAHQGSPLENLKPDQRATLLTDALRTAYVNVQLLKARGAFLKNLAGIGQAGESTNWGRGRVDAFGSVRTLFFDPKHVPNAPVSFPPLWGMEQLPWFHYDSNTTSVLQRNLGQALGVGAVFDRKTLASTLRPVNSHTLEHQAYQIKAPSWPADLFGAVDKVRARRGEHLYSKHCASCHSARIKNGDFPQFTPKVLGTDPLRAETFLAVMPDDGPYKGQTFWQALRDVLGPVTQKALDDAVGAHEITQAQADAWKMERPNDWQGSGKYTARPLVSIWATPPYLHNGSVASLDDLLKPAKDRLPNFYLGSREFDPIRVGYSTAQVAGASFFDTGKPGNSNKGHEYGTDLGDSERGDLIEYLKTK